MKTDPERYSYLAVVKNGLEINAYTILTVQNAASGTNSVSGTKTTYAWDETAAFTAVPGQAMLPVSGNTGWLPVSWQVEGLSGSWQSTPYEASFSAEGLAAGSHTLKITFFRRYT